MFDPLLGWLDEHRRALGAAEDSRRDSAIVTAALARMTALGERGELPSITNDALEPGRILFGDHVGSLLDRLSTDYQVFSGEAASLVDGAASQALKGGNALYGDSVPDAQRDAVLAQLEQGIETHGQREVAAWVRGLVDEVEDQDVTASFEALVIPGDDGTRGFLDGEAPTGRRGEFAALLPPDRPATPPLAAPKPAAVSTLPAVEPVLAGSDGEAVPGSAVPDQAHHQAAGKAPGDERERTGADDGRSDEGVPALVLAGLAAVLVVLVGALAYVLVSGDDNDGSSTATDAAESVVDTGTTETDTTAPDTTATGTTDTGAADTGATDTTSGENAVGDESAESEPDPTAAPASSTAADNGDEACSAESNRAVQSALGEGAGLSIFTLFVCEAGLADLLSSGDVGTALAPTDQAIGALGVDTISALRADAPSLDIFVRAHLVPEPTAALRDGDVLVTLAENVLEVVADGAALSIAGVMIESTTSTDELTVHQLSGVLANIQQTDPSG